MTGGGLRETPGRGGRKLLGAAAWMAAGNWIEQGVNFAVFVLLARILGVDAFGAIAMASVVVVLCEFLVRETFADGLIAMADPGPGDRDAAFWLLAASGTALTAILAVIAGPMAALYDLPLVRDLVIGLSPTVLITALTAVPVALLRRDMRFRVMSLRAIAGVAAGAVVGIGMALTGWGVWALVGQRLALVLANAALAWGAVDWRPGWSATRDDVSRAARFGGAAMGLRAAELSATQAPILILGATLGTTATGLYSVAWRIVDILAFLVVVPLRMVAQPAFAAEARAGQSPGALLGSIARFSGLLAFPLFAGIAAVRTPALEVLFGRDWLSAAPALGVLALCGAYFSVEKVQQSLCLAAGRPAPVTLVAWLNVAMIAAFSVIAVPHGITAVAAAVLAGYLIPWPLRFRIAAGIAGQPVGTLIRPHLGPALAAAVMAGFVAPVVRLAPERPLLALILGVLTGAVTFTALVLVYFRDRVDELRRILTRRGDPAARVPETDPDAR